MDKDKLRLLAAKGKKANEMGKTHRWTKEEASRAGKVSGKMREKTKKKSSQNTSKADV